MASVLKFQECIFRDRESMEKLLRWCDGRKPGVNGLDEGYCSGCSDFVTGPRDCTPIQTYTGK